MSTIPRPFGVAIPSRSLRASRSVATAAELTAKGTAYDGASLRIKRMVGQGSFGEVFEGSSLVDGEETRIILKRVKKVTGATEMGQLEHLLNVHVKKHAPGSCADFLGFSEIEGSHQVVDKRITPGTWLLWRYQGSMTLAEYLRRRDCNQALARDMGIPEAAVPATVIKQLLECLQKLHAAGLVHRDVKPSNIIFCEEDRRFRLIDLGACADLRSGTNYNPDESILDPNYCPPEQYVLPTDAPDLARKHAAMQIAIAPMLWVRHKPDRFDMYSVGLIMLQLAMPHLRSSSALQGFHTSFRRCRYDLERWRTVSSLKSVHTVVMDAADGAGWELAEALLRPRKVQTLADGHVYFTNEGRQRPSAVEALAYRFVRDQAVDTSQPTAEAASDSDAAANAPTTSKPAGGGFFGMFKQMQYKVFQLEADILRTAGAAEQQTTTVRQLRNAVQVGEASPDELQKAESVLQRLSSNLGRLQNDLVYTAKNANFAFRSGLIGTKQVEKEELLAMLEVEDGTESSKSAPQSPRKASAPVPTAPYSPGNNTAVVSATPAPKEPPAKQGLAGFLFQGIKSIGRAVKITSNVVEDVQVLVENIEKTQEEKRRTAADFMQLLNEKGIKVTDEWSKVQKKLLGDPRYEAVVGERKLVLFKSYLTALRELEDSRLQIVEKDFVKLLSQRVVGLSDANWEVLKKEWKNDERFKALGEASAFVLFERHVAALQDAYDKRKAALDFEVAYRALLENAQPPVTGDTTWAQIRRRIWNEPAYLNVPDVRRREIFNEFREIVRDLEALEVSKEAAWRDSIDAPDRPGKFEPSGPIVPLDGDDTVDDVAVLNLLRDEQAKLKAEYDRMESKLRAMEERLQSRAGASLDEVASTSRNGASKW